MELNKETNDLQEEINEVGEYHCCCGHRFKQFHGKVRGLICILIGELMGRQSRSNWIISLKEGQVTGHRNILFSFPYVLAACLWQSNSEVRKSNFIQIFSITVTGEILLHISQLPLVMLISKYGIGSIISAMISFKFTTFQFHPSEIIPYLRNLKKAYPDKEYKGHEIQNNPEVRRAKITKLW